MYKSALPPVFPTAFPIVCSEIKLKNFRCFESVSFNFEKPIVLLEGLNGVGKTSLLEALYYACYLRSFRTHLPKELIRFGQESFFVRIQLSHMADQHEIQVGFSHDKRSVKVDKKNISSYKELMDHYRVVSLIEDDLSLIKGGPHERRAFIDSAILLDNADFAPSFKEFRRVLSNRNNLIQHMTRADDNYMIWTQQLWEHSYEIQEKRKQLLTTLIDDVNQLVSTYFDRQYTITCSYEAKKMRPDQSFASFLQENPTMLEYERRFKRSFFGAHLDDFTIKLEDKETKRLASRGQQKLILFLLKVAQARHIVARSGPILFLLDDFMIDFDLIKVRQLLSLLSHLDSQLILTTPASESVLSSYAQEMGAQEISLTRDLTHSIKASI